MLRWIVDGIFYRWLGLDPDLRWVQSLNFFVYDFFKISFLLLFMITVIGYLRSFLPQEKISEWLKGKRFKAHLAASLFGALTPFCSCSSIPLFLSFIYTGIPLGITFSFLVTSPLINEYLVVLMFGFFGWKITVIYVISGLVIGVGVGLLIGKLGLEEHIEEDMIGPFQERKCQGKKSITHQDRISQSWRSAWSTVKKLWLWIFVGVGLGAIIHNYVPETTIQNISNKTGLFSVPLATLLGVPLYGSCAAIIPIAVALFKKGIPLGTALAFMMAISALSLPEAVLLKRALKLKLILIFFGITALGIIITGYLFNIWQIYLT